MDMERACPDVPQEPRDSGSRPLTSVFSRGLA